MYHDVKKHPFVLTVNPKSTLGLLPLTTSATAVGSLATTSRSAPCGW